jgi:T5orf172 domain
MWIMSYDQNDGKAGVVYILENPALNNLLKIGQTTYNGAYRASQLNSDAKTGMPAEYKCVFEIETIDCGRAEKEVHNLLEKYRRGKYKQEFFNVSLDKAISCVQNVCNKFNGNGYMVNNSKSNSQNILNNTGPSQINKINKSINGNSIVNIANNLFNEITITSLVYLLASLSLLIIYVILFSYSKKDYPELYQISSNLNTVNTVNHKIFRCIAAYYTVLFVEPIKIGIKIFDFIELHEFTKYKNINLIICLILSCLLPASIYYSSYHIFYKHYTEKNFNIGLILFLLLPAILGLIVMIIWSIGYGIFNWLLA